MDLSITSQSSSSATPPENLSAYIKQTEKYLNDLAASGKYYMYGIGEVQIEPTGETSSAVQEIWNEQMAVITDIVTRASADPSQSKASDLNALVGALKELESLAKNGVTTEAGTSYLTKEMATSLSLMLFELDKVGINSSLDVKSLSDSQKLNLLSALNSEIIVTTVKAASDFKDEDLGLQTYIYVQMQELMEAQTDTVKDVKASIELDQAVLETLNDLIDIAGYVSTPEPWPYDPTLASPGSIPPAAVPEVQKYIEENDGNSDEKGFQAAYDREYAAAETRAAQNGTTVQYEMTQADKYPPYTVNGKRTDEQTSAQILQHFMGNKGDEYRINGINQIMLEAVTVELENVPTLPEGKTWTDVGTDIWNVKTNLETQIQNLTDQGASEDLIESLQKVVDNIDKLWAEALQQNNLPASTTFEQLAANTSPNAVKAMEDFSKSVISSLQPGQSAANDLTNTIKQFENWNQELQKDFEKVMQLLDMLYKTVTQLLKQMSDINKSYSKRI